jgi:hypothetical protein
MKRVSDPTKMKSVELNNWNTIATKFTQQVTGLQNIKDIGRKSHLLNVKRMFQTTGRSIT